MDKKGEAKVRGMAVVRIPMSFIALLPHEKSIQGGICTKDGTGKDGTSNGTSVNSKSTECCHELSSEKELEILSLARRR